MAGQVSGQYLCHPGAVRRRMPRAHDSDCRPSQQLHVTQHPKHWRRIENLPQLLGIILVFKSEDLAFLFSDPHQLPFRLGARLAGEKELGSRRRKVKRLEFGQGKAKQAGEIG